MRELFRTVVNDGAVLLGPELAAGLIADYRPAQARARKIKKIDQPDSDPGPNEVRPGIGRGVEEQRPAL